MQKCCITQAWPSWIASSLMINMIWTDDSKAGFKVSWAWQRSSRLRRPNIEAGTKWMKMTTRIKPAIELPVSSAYRNSLTLIHSDEEEAWTTMRWTMNQRPPQIPHLPHRCNLQPLAQGSNQPLPSSDSDSGLRRKTSTRARRRRSPKRRTTADSINEVRLDDEEEDPGSSGLPHVRL